MSCAGSALGYGSAGCNGGYSTDAFNYEFKYSQASEAAYPYSSASSVNGVTGTCSSAILATKTAANSVGIASSPGYTSTQSYSATALMQVILCSAFCPPPARLPASEPSRHLSLTAAHAPCPPYSLQAVAAQPRPLLT